MRVPAIRRQAPLPAEESREQAALCEWSRFEEPDDDLVEVLPAIAADSCPPAACRRRTTPARKTGVRGMPTTRPARMPRLRSCPTKTSAGCGTLRAEGFTLQELADVFVVSLATIKRAVRGDTYGDVMPLPEVLDDELLVQAVVNQPEASAEEQEDWGPMAD